MSDSHPEPVVRRAPVRPGRRRQGRALAAVGLAAVVAAGVWLAVRHHGGTARNATGAVAVSAQGLRTIANALRQPIYWAGPRPGMTYELTHTTDGRIYVRYLPHGVPVGASTPYLTVGTYPDRNAFGGTSKVAHARGSVLVPVGGGAVAFYSTGHPTSVYLAWPGVSYQVEVYSPSAGQARQLVRQGLIRAVGPAAVARPVGPNGAVAATVADLTRLERTLGRKVYWAGSEAGVTYELSRSGGRVYLRYLPAGAALGSSAPYLTVATYPYKGAYQATSATASEPGSVRVAVPGGVAFYARTRPTNVYVAFKGIDEQVEVFDPSPGRARALVAAGKITPVP